MTSNRYFARYFFIWEFFTVHSLFFSHLHNAKFDGSKKFLMSLLKSSCFQILSIMISTNNQLLWISKLEGFIENGDPYKRTTNILRWNDVEKVVFTSFQRGIHVVRL